MKTILLAAAMVTVVAPGLGNAQVLTGSDVSAAVYCCTAPHPTNRISTIGTAVVGDEVEFPNGSLVSLSPFWNLIPVDVDIGATTIELQYSTDDVAGSAAFNGHVIWFEGAPTIVGVSVNPASTFAPVAVTFLADRIMINSANVLFNPDSRLLLDIALVVPEPATGMMMMAGLSLLGLYAWRRRD